MMARFEDDFEFLGKGSGLIGRKEEEAEVVYRIASGNMLLIEGEKGAGKTALLKYAIDNFKGLGRVVYIDVGTFGRRLDISELLSGRSNGMILLIDNIEYLSESNNRRIKYFYDQDRIKSVVFATNDSKAINFTDAIRSRIGRNIMKLKTLDKGEALKIARDRLKEDVVISDEVLDKLYEESKDLRRFLINCDSLCSYLDMEERKEAEVSDIAKVVFEGVVDEVVEGCLECNGELVEVGGHWRCRNCDSYCDACGTLSYDDFCPACGEEILGEEDE